MCKSKPEKDENRPLMTRSRWARRNDPLQALSHRSLPHSGRGSEGDLCELPFSRQTIEMNRNAIADATSNMIGSLVGAIGGAVAGPAGKKPERKYSAARRALGSGIELIPHCVDCGLFMRR
jgi:hypothetical protein